MSNIHKIGDNILLIQSTMGLVNASMFAQGLTLLEQQRYAFLGKIFHGTEANDLFAWRNGVILRAEIAMADLWIIPGFVFLPAQRVQDEHDYNSIHVTDWSPNWFPIMSTGTADYLFLDSTRIEDEKIPVMYATWEASRSSGQIYDSIQAMMETFLHCYKEAAYYRDSSGCLTKNSQLEATLSLERNPSSDYWRQSNLY